MRGTATVADDRRPLITLGMQLCVQRDGRLGVKQRCAGPSALADVLVCSTIKVF